MCSLTDPSTLSELAELKQPPWPKEDLLQRATMGRNTLRRQLERAIQQQKEYEQANSEKLEASRKAREEVAKQRQAEAERLAKEEEERQAKLAAERKQMQDQARAWAEAAAAKLQEDAQLASEPKKRKPRKGKGSKKGTGEDEDEDELSTDEVKEERPKRKRRVARPNAISEEKVVESSEEEPEQSAVVSGDEKPKKKRKVLSQARILDSDDEDEIMRESAGVENVNGGAQGADGSDDDLFGEEAGDKMAED